MWTESIAAHIRLGDTNLLDRLFFENRQRANE